MTDLNVPKLNKLPFFAADALLLCVAGWVVYQTPHPIGMNSVWLIAILTFTGAWMAIIPFLMEYRAAVKVAEASGLTTVVEQMNDLRTLANQISFATAQWQVVQDQASQTVKVTHEISDRMTKEAQAFSVFMQKTNDAEKAHLRLEVDKLRRGESEWLQGAVLLLDHVYALHKAGQRSGQTVLMEQLGHFQAACRDSVRRLGLTPFEASVNEPFDEAVHQLLEGDEKPLPGTLVGQCIATGYTFQGKLLRKAVVALQPPSPEVTQAAQGELLSPAEEK
jgi:molecular chaperone GrpE (heat shock protein)